VQARKNPDSALLHSGYNPFRPRGVREPMNHFVVNT
jgi:hypothetical protein